MPFHGARSVTATGIAAIVALLAGASQARADGSAAPPQTAPAPTTSAGLTEAPRPRRERPGPALTLGLGIPYAGAGAQLRYDLPLARLLAVSPYVGAGVFGVLPGPFGVVMTYGARVRLTVEVGVAPLEKIYLDLHGTRVAEQTLHGPMAGVGIEHMGDSGWLQRFTVEYGYAAWGSAVPAPSPHIGAFSLAVGRRIW